MSLPSVCCTREMFEDMLYEGKEALGHRQAALLWCFTQMMHNLFREISCDDSYTYEQKTEILKADDALTELITGGKPNFFHGKSSVNAATEAVCCIKLGNREKALDLLESAYCHADKYENRPDGEKIAPCWLSELDDKREYTGKTSPDTVYGSIYNIITNPNSKLCEVLEGDKRFEALMEKRKEKISR